MHARIAQGLTRDILVGVHHVASQWAKVFEDGCLDIGFDADLLPGFAHVAEPAPGRPIIDDEGQMLAPQTRVAVELGLSGRPAKPLFQDQLELLLARFEIVRVNRTEVLVNLDATVERLHDGGDRLAATDAGVKGLRFKGSGLSHANCSRPPLPIGAIADGMSSPKSTDCSRSQFDPALKKRMTVWLSGSTSHTSRTPFFS